MEDVQERLRQILAERTDTSADDWFLVYRARHGMLVVLCELARLAGSGEVVTQLLTCCTAVDPIVAAGLTPIYGDVSPQTLALDAAALPNLSQVVAIMDQHTFGYIDQESSSSLRAAANARSALLLEDCAHCAGRMAMGKDGTPLADVSFHSFGVEKMLPTYFGGAVWVNPKMADARLHDNLVEALAMLPQPTGALARAMRGYRTQIRVLNHLPAAAAHALRSLLLALGAFEPAISSEELAGGVAHKPLAMGEWACEQVMGLFEELPQSYPLRVAALASFERELAGIQGIATSQRMLRSGQPLLRVPVSLPTNAQADAAIDAIAHLGLYAVPWYRPLLYPGVSNPEVYGFDSSLEGLPHTAELTRGAVALPVDISPEQVSQVAAVLRQAARV